MGETSTEVSTIKRVPDKYRFISGFVTVWSSGGLELYRQAFHNVGHRKGIMSKFRKRYGPENFDNGKYYFTIIIEATE